ncbi:MAG: hypothetical protein GXO71_02515 [Caldiserica bacterium]|nr:hypothetical protein [Caldisericota bacterium]
MPGVFKRWFRVLLIVFSITLMGKVANVNIYGGEEGGILQGSPVGISADVTINSKYIWRGFTLDDDPVIQQGIYVSAYGLTFSVWSSLDMEGDDELNSDEVDYVLDYTCEADKFSLSVGYTHYDFPEIDGKSKEYYVGFGLNVPLSPTLTWYRDYGNEDTGGGDGEYTVLAVSHSVPVGTSPVTLDLSGSVGYNSKLFIEGKGGDYNVGIGLSIPLTESCSLSPNVNYSVPFGDLKKASDGDQEEKFYGGITLSFNL